MSCGTLLVFPVDADMVSTYRASTLNYFKSYELIVERSLESSSPLGHYRCQALGMD